METKAANTDVNVEDNFSPENSQADSDSNFNNNQSDSSGAGLDFSNEDFFDYSQLAMVNTEESDDSDSEIPDSDASTLDLVNDLIDDPEFISRGSMFNSYQPGTVDLEDKESDPLEDTHPAIINVYIQTFVSATFHCATYDAAKILLDGNQLMLESVVSHVPNLSFPGLSKFAQTLPTVEWQLGLATGDFIMYYILCDQCWKPHNPRTLGKLPSLCDQPNCAGVL